MALPHDRTVDVYSCIIKICLEFQRSAHTNSIDSATRQKQVDCVTHIIQHIVSLLSSGSAFRWRKQTIRIPPSDTDEVCDYLLYIMHLNPHLNTSYLLNLLGELNILILVFEYIKPIHPTELTKYEHASNCVAQQRSIMGLS